LKPVVVDPALEFGDDADQDQEHCAEQLVAPSSVQEQLVRVAIAVPEQHELVGLNEVVAQKHAVALDEEAEVAAVEATAIELLQLVPVQQALQLV
jgi:hypothetical protein